jgi:hypothetical protein
VGRGLRQRPRRLRRQGERFPGSLCAFGTVIVGLGSSGSNSDETPTSVAILDEQGHNPWSE